MKLENNWKQKTLENLEKVRWEDVSMENSYLVIRVNQLRKIPIEQFTTEDLRLMIGQNVGLFYLIPIAIECLKRNLFAEGDYYEGDLLNAILSVKESFWKENKSYWVQIDELLKNKIEEISQHKPKINTVSFYSVFNK